MGKIGVWIGGALAVGIVGIIVYLGAGSFLHRTPTATGIGQGTNERQSSASDWALRSESNAMDGNVIHAEKAFEFPDQKSRIVVTTTCIPKSKSFQVEVASYSNSPSGDSYPGMDFVTTVGNNLQVTPNGRIKFGTDDPIALSTAFTMGDYHNVMNWSVPSPDALRGKLPVIIEVQNAGGTEQVVIPANDAAIGSVIDKCSTQQPPLNPQPGNTGQQAQTISGEFGAFVGKDMCDVAKELDASQRLKEQFVELFGADGWQTWTGFGEACAEPIQSIQDPVLGTLIVFQRFQTHAATTNGAVLIKPDGEIAGICMATDNTSANWRGNGWQQSRTGESCYGSDATADDVNPTVLDKRLVLARTNGH